MSEENYKNQTTPKDLITTLTTPKEQEKVLINNIRRITF